MAEIITAANSLSMPDAIAIVGIAFAIAWVLTK